MSQNNNYVLLIIKVLAVNIVKEGVNVSIAGVRNV